VKRGVVLRSAALVIGLRAEVADQLHDMVEPERGG
jgi:hypothetical protein